MVSVVRVCETVVFLYMVMALLVRLGALEMVVITVIKLEFSTPPYAIDTPCRKEKALL